MRRTNRWLALAVILAAECMDLLDSTIVNVAAPAIHRNLGTSPTGLEWIVGGYPLALAVGLITGGRLGDLVGRRRMFLVGVAGFTVASVLCGLAPSTGALIAFRVLQGLAAAVMLPQGFGVIREVFAPEEIGQAFAIFGPVLGIAAVVGPVVGGALVGADLFGSTWRSVFFVNAPIGLLGLAGAWWLLPPTAPVARKRLDLTGTVLSGAACFALVYPLIQGRALGWPAWTYLLIAASVGLFAVLAVQQRRRERRGAEPLVVTSVLRHRGYSAGLLGMTVFFGGLGGVLLVVSVFLQVGERFTAIGTGVALIPMALGMAVGAGLSGAVLARRYGRLVIVAGALVTGLGWLLVELLAIRGTSALGTVDLLPGLALTGLGSGLIVASLFDDILAAVTDEETGSASGLLNAVQQLAAAVGVAVFGTIFFGAIRSQGFRAAMERTLWVEVGAMVGLAVLAFALPRHARPEDAALGAGSGGGELAAAGAAGSAAAGAAVGAVSPANG